MKEGRKEGEREGREKGLFQSDFSIMPVHFGYQPRNIGGLGGKGNRRKNKKAIHC